MAVLPNGIGEFAICGTQCGECKRAVGILTYIICPSFDSHEKCEFVVISVKLVGRVCPCVKFF